MLYGLIDLRDLRITGECELHIRHECLPVDFEFGVFQDIKVDLDTAIRICHDAGEEAML